MAIVDPLQPVANSGFRERYGATLEVSGRCIATVRSNDILGLS
jgi:hypothetical protein